jgi:hypothetical protein
MAARHDFPDGTIPRRFCFERTQELPAFVRKARRKLLQGVWMHRLCL